MSWMNRLTELKTDGMTYNQIADVLSDEFDERFTGSRVRGWWRRNGSVQKSGDTNDLLQNDAKGKQEYSNGAYTFENIVELIEGEDVTPDMMVKAHGLKVGMWEVVSYKNNFWQSQQKGGKKIVLYQSKIIVKATKGAVAADTVKDIFNDLHRTLPVKVIEHPKNEQRKMAEVNIADLHLGKLCWHGNTGENYDHKIAKANFEGIVERICERLKTLDLEYILLVWSNDYFNSDNEESTTTKGTLQDTDIRFEKLLKVGTQMLVWAIERLKEVAPVQTFRTPSNHDNVLSMAALIMIMAWFRNDEQVTIHEDVTPRKYVLFGNSLTGFCHGDTEGRESKSKEKASRLASLMPNEARELWSKARFHEMHTAHLHSEQTTNEINGVTVRRISSPTASDTWHVNSGYVGSTRKATTFIYDKEDGIIETIYTPIRQSDRVFD